MRKFSDGRISERAIYLKGKHAYECAELDGDSGKIKVYYDKTGILGANDKHISWEEIEKIKNLLNNK